MISIMSGSVGVQEGLGPLVGQRRRSLFFACFDEYEALLFTQLALNTSGRVAEVF